MNQVLGGIQIPKWEATISVGCQANSKVMAVPVAVFAAKGIIPLLITARSTRDH